MRKIPRARLVVALAALFGHRGVGRGVLATEILEARLAAAAGDGFEMEFDVTVEPRIEDAQQMAAELLARGAGESMTPPHRAQRMNARVAAADGRGESLLQRIITAKRGLQRGHPLGRKGFVEKAFEFSVRNGHWSAVSGPLSVVFVVASFCN